MPHPSRGAPSILGGEVVFIGAEIALGQQVFLRDGLMDNGTVWGHGAYLGPDFSAQQRPPSLDPAARHRAATLRYPYAEFRPKTRRCRSRDGGASQENRYDPSSERLTLLAGGQSSSTRRPATGNILYRPRRNGGLGANAIADPLELRASIAFLDRHL
jgi:nitric oxide reductase subunit B